MGTRNVTSSQVSGDGLMQLNLLDGLETELCGPDRRPVSPSAQQASGSVQTMRVTSGPSGSTSSGSADLQRFLESKLAQRFATGGLTNSRLTWKAVITPSGRSLSRLQVSAPCTSETVFGSWPTAAATDHKGGYRGGRIRNGKFSVDRLDVAAQLTQWPTVTTQDNVQMAGQYSKTNGTTLGGAVRQCNAKTAKSGSYQLNPRFSLWLMGYGIEWARCAERVTLSSRKSLQKS